MISNDKNTSYSTDLCLLKKKLNVHGKYKFNYVHYVIDETNWDEILTKSNLKTNKNNISPLRLKEILERLIAGYDMKTVSNIVGLNQDQFITYLTELQLKQSVAMLNTKRNVNCVVWT
ncbi:hypothetical protein K668_00965 [Mycoplasmopsis bovis CQ-W70]|uniref:Uncharacterized protein n=1 Tax=Mycoplasmopsis bovis CQ-W70 TaxID=1316930 RepID=A0A059Y7Z7_MYCBV|nr:hypothetical protein MMB_0190 [Mycoplasmopsis bovis Hubei-1]AIA33781.1 hypothetical protein K668_00965 [Mycoplasmopsis bovis CQ-W70]